MIKLTQKLSLELYSSPKMRTVEMKTEGMLCTSYDVANADYDYENDLGEI